MTHRSSEGAARSGRLATPHGQLATPAFLPVGTYGAVRGLTPAELREVGVEGILANTWHLHLRPGERVIEALGGLHGFTGWRGPILTDSGGFQVHSLAHLCARSEEGVRLRSPVDGSERMLSPERCIAIQEALGADLVVALDEFAPVEARPDPAGAPRVREMLERTLRWAERCRAAQRRADQMLFGIVHGGGFEDLRAESAERTAALDFRGHAVGGLGLGEGPALRARLLEASLAPLPEALPRYLMGLGRPEDLVEGVARGMDLFDCVVPTRHGRHGVVFTAQGPLHLRNGRYRDDPGPVDGTCACPVCRTWSRAYVRHLLVSRDPLGGRLASLHNLAYYMSVMRQIREAVVKDRFEAWRREWLAAYASGNAAHSAA